MKKFSILGIGQRLSHQRYICRASKLVSSFSIKNVRFYTNEFHGRILKGSPSICNFRKLQERTISKINYTIQDGEDETSKISLESDDLYDNDDIEYDPGYENDTIYGDEMDNILDYDQIDSDDNIYSNEMEDSFLKEHTLSEKASPASSKETCAPLISKPITKAYLSIEKVKDILENQMCIDLCCIKVDQKRIGAKYVDYFVVVSGRSTRHLKAMAFNLVLQFKKDVIAKKGRVTAVVEGQDCHDWMVVDIGNIVVHFMLPETREHYQLESLWSLGPDLDPQYQQMLQDEKLFDQTLITNDELNKVECEFSTPASNDDEEGTLPESVNHILKNEKQSTQQIESSVISEDDTNVGSIIKSNDSQSNKFQSNVSQDHIHTLLRNLKEDLDKSTKQL